MKFLPISGPRKVLKWGFCASGRASRNICCCQVSSQPNCSGLSGDRHRKRMEALGREERDHLGPKDRGVFGIGRIEHDHGVDAGVVCERVVDRCGPGRIVGDRDDLSQAQHLDDRFEVTELLFETVDSADGFVGTAKTQEIECDDPSPASYQVGDQVVVDV